MRLGFIAWNKFQISQVAPILKYNPTDHVALLFQTDRPHADTSIIDNPPDWCSVVSITREQTSKVDGLFDAVLTQTALPEASGFTSTKVLAIQYSMAKEQHQYGAWHYMADGRLNYGPYSDSILSFYGNSYQVGNPRFDVLFDGSINEETRASVRKTLDSRKKTVLYVPTYGKLSSFESFLPACKEIGDKFNLIVSGHHNTMLREGDRSSIISEISPTGSADLTPYYYEAADVVISDYSGAIFDAILCRKPVILFRPGKSKIGIENLTEDSIEIARQNSIGPIVRDAKNLIKHIDNALADFAFFDQNLRLRDECFVNIGSAGASAYETVSRLISHTPELPKAQAWVRSAITRRYQSK